MSSHYLETLHREIVALSDASTWNEAKNQWALGTLFYDEDGTTCLCTYDPINYCCEIINHLNGNRTIVGSTCVKQFWGNDYKLEFESFKRLQTDPHSAMNSALLQHAKKQHWLNDREYRFYWDTCRKRHTTLSFEELARRENLNERVAQRMSRTRVQIPAAHQPGSQRCRIVEKLISDNYSAFCLKT